MVQQRHISRRVNVPPLAPGFVGPGHLAAQVVSAVDFALNDPFIMLADDNLNIGNRPLGGPHPHAGFETVTLLLDGAIYDRDEGGTIAAGEVQWMTAGSGIIHGEHTMTKGPVRLLQLWLTLPKAARWTEPSFQDVHASAVPVRHEPGATLRLYSGSSGDLQSATRNQVPVTIAEIFLDPKASIEQELPLSFNGFVYVLRGWVRVGDDAEALDARQVGWLDRPAGDGPSVVKLTAGNEGARVVFYAGQPQGDPIASHGPFIGDSRDDIPRLYSRYRAGGFPSMSELTRETVQ